MNDQKDAGSRFSDPVDEQLARELAALPRVRASEDFTERVLQNLPETSPHWTRRTAVWALPLAAALLLALLIPKFLGPAQTADPSELESLAAQLELLQSEFQTVSDDFDNEPVVYLGGDDELSFTFDMREMARPQAIPVNHSTTSSGGIQP